jgi:hypothetical protein
MGKRRCAYSILVGIPEGRSHLEYPGVDGRVILKWVLKNQGLDSSGS